MHEPRESKYLPFTPPPRWTTNLKYDLIRDGKIINNAFVGFNFEYNFEQNHFYAEGNTETFTPDYGLINLHTGADFILLKQRTSLFIEVTNLTNKSYQNHLSRLKYTAINNATKRQGIYNMGRNICFKLVIPLLL